MRWKVAYDDKHSRFVIIEEQPGYGYSWDAAKERLFYLIDNGIEKQKDFLAKLEDDKAWAQMEYSEEPK